MTDTTPFVAGDALTPPHARPLRWIDGASYLMFDRVVSGAVGPATADPTDSKPGVSAPGGIDPGMAESFTFYRVSARTGDRVSLLDGSALRAVLRGERVPLALVDAALGRLESYVWSDDFTRVVINVADDLYLFDVDGTAITQLTVTVAPELGARFSPDGRRLAFVADFDLYVVDIADAAAPGDPIQVTTEGDENLLIGRLDWVYQEEVWGRDDYQGFWWSPDSRRIALMRLDEGRVRGFTLVHDAPVEPAVEVAFYPKAGARNPIASLGLVDIEGLLTSDREVEVRWLEQPGDNDSERLIVRVDWHPDSTELWFQVQDRSQTWLEMRAAAVAPSTSPIRLVFREDSDCWVENGPQPRWLRDGAEFLWQSERDGREHLYRYSRNGDLLGQVTRGEFDVEAVSAVDEQAGHVWFLTDRTDPKQLHLWRVDLPSDGRLGQNAEQITGGRGWHDVRVSPDRSLFLEEYNAIDYRLAHRVYDLASGELVRTIVASDMQQLAPFELAAPELLQVEARDGFLMEAVLIKPPDYREGRRYPVLCHTYSGPHAPRALDRWRDRDYLWHQLMAQRGYLIWICDNRSASGKGRKVHKACHHNFGMEAVRDLEDGVRFLIDSGYADPARVGIWGWSFGGYQTLYCLTHSKVWQIGVAINPVTDWRFYDSIYTERYLGMPQDNCEAYDRASVLHAAGNLRGDLLLVHATMDNNVHLQHSMQFVHALQQAGKRFRFMPYPRVRHRIFDRRQQEHLFRMMSDFVVEKL